MKTYAETLDERAAFMHILRDSWITVDSWSEYSGRVDGVEFATRLEVGDSYFAASDFIDLVENAAGLLPEGASLEAEDFMSGSGWLSLARPLRFGDLLGADLLEYRVSGFGWLPVTSRDRQYGGALLFFVPEGRDDISTALMPFGMAHAGTGNAWLKAFWLLLSQQTVSETTEEVPPRAARKRAERAGMNPTVRVIRLPRRVREGATAEHGAVDWQSRWIVSGHWRNQPWGPERKRRRPVWIAPYIKGPDDKPVKESAHRLFVASAP